MRIKFIGGGSSWKVLDTVASTPQEDVTLYSSVMSLFHKSQYLLTEFTVSYSLNRKPSSNGSVIGFHALAGMPPE